MPSCRIVTTPRLANSSRNEAGRAAPDTAGSWRDCADSGWGRRVSEKRRTSASVLASKKITWNATPSPRSCCSSGIRCGSDPALRTSTPMATRRPSRLCSSVRKPGSSSGGRLSTQKKPASSSACRATDFPEPEMPVTRTMFSGFGSAAAGPGVLMGVCVRAPPAPARRRRRASPAHGPGWCPTGVRRRACARSRPRAPRPGPLARGWRSSRRAPVW